MTTEMYTITPLGEAALSVSFGHAISPDIHRHVRALGEYLEKNPFPGFIENILSYTAVTVMYDPFFVKTRDRSDRTAAEIVGDIIRQAVDEADKQPLNPAAVVEIPVCYGGEYGPDLEYVASCHDMTPEEVVKIHSSAEYLVYMIGFCPGFPYMGGLDDRIATPRRKSPRLEIPARSVGIAGQQTGAYPLATPGGWQIIGRSAVELFTPEGQTPSLLKSGDKVHFIPVDKAKYEEIRGDDK